MDRKCFTRMSALTASMVIILSLVSCGNDDSPAPVSPEPKGPITLQLLAFNDFHGNLEPTGLALTLPDPADATKTVRVNTGGGAFLATKLAELRGQNVNTIVISSGDLIGASPLVSSLFRDEPTLELMNAIGIDVNVVGNHEFDKGVKELERIVKGGCNADTSDPNLSSCARTGATYAGAKFPFLAANVEDASGKPIYAPYLVKTFSDFKVGVIGVVLRSTPTIVAPAGVAGVTFKDEAETINRYVDELKKQGVEAIVAVVHEGGVTDSTWNDTVCANARGEVFAIVDKLKADVDVVFSGHTHQGYNCVRNGIRVMQAFAFGRGVSQLTATLDPKTRDFDRTTIRAQNVPVVNTTNIDAAVTAKFPPVAADAAAKKIVDDYVVLAAPKANRPIGQISATIDRTVAANGAGDHSAGRLIADAQLAATRDAAKGGAQIAFMNPGGVRADFTCVGAAPCTVTFGSAFTVQPFGNSLVVMTLTGQQIKEVLEQQFTGVNAQRPRILQPSKGFTYTYDNAAAAGSKISAMTLEGQALNLTQTYRVTVNSFLSDGGDGFTVLTGGANKLGGAQDIDALISYFAVNSPIAPDAVGRITRVN